MRQKQGVGLWGMKHQHQKMSYKSQKWPQAAIILWWPRQYQYISVYIDIAYSKVTLINYSNEQVYSQVANWSSAIMSRLWLVLYFVSTLLDFRMTHIGGDWNQANGLMPYLEMKAFTLSGGFCVTSLLTIDCRFCYLHYVFGFLVHCFATVSWFDYLQAGSSATLLRHSSVLNDHSGWQIIRKH